MPHPLANDPSVPECLRRGFARVSCQIVRHYDDGKPAGIINFIDRAKADLELPKHQARIGINCDGKVLVAVEIRAVA